MSTPDEPQPPIRVMVVDDHGVVRKGLRTFLATAPDIDVVGEATDGQDAIAQIQRAAGTDLSPEVVLMDLMMEPVDGIEATSVIRSRHPDIQVVALTSFVEEEKVHQALDAGASGFLLKDAEADEVAAAVRAAHRGEVHLDPAVAGRLIRSMRTPPHPAGGPELTDREEEVLRLVAEGKANKAIAAELFISERTARTHVSNILSKLGLASRTQAALWAIRAGLAPSLD